jgi:hypothetical protein
MHYQCVGKPFFHHLSAVARLKVSTPSSQFIAMGVRGFLNLGLPDLVCAWLIHCPACKHLSMDMLIVSQS